MPKGLKRYYGLGHLHFLTFSCYRRLPLLRTAEARNLFVNVLAVMRERHGFLLVGYVVMPEHVHLLIGEPAEGTPSIVLQALKQRVSRDLREKARRLSPGEVSVAIPAEDGSLARFWHSRFHDFNVHSAGKRREKLDYMQANPVKRGLVKDPLAWVWSSASFYATGVSGQVPIDPVP
jgi:putative transposase